MSKKNIIILSLCTAFLIFALAFFGYTVYLKQNKTNTKTSNTSVPETKQEVSQYFYDIDGNKLNLDDFFDKPVVLLLWKSDNSKSYSMISLVTKHYEEYKDKINFLAINVDEANLNLSLIEDVKAANFKIPMYFDTDFKISEEFSYTRFPELIFMSQDGNIEKEVAEQITEDTFLANLELLET